MGAEGAVWAQTTTTFRHSHRDAMPTGAVVRVREQSEALQPVVLDPPIFATMLGGPDPTTLFLPGAEWRGIEHVDEAIAVRMGQILVSTAPAPGAG